MAAATIGGRHDQKQRRDYRRSGARIGGRQAGLAAGDQVTSVTSQTVTSASDIQSVLGDQHPGDRISISWTDQFGQSQTATVSLAAGPGSLRTP